MAGDQNNAPVDGIAPVHGHVPIVVCQRDAYGEYRPQAANATNYGRRRINFIETDPNTGGEFTALTLDVDGPDDPAIKAGVAAASALPGDVTAPDRAMAAYRHAAMLKATQPRPARTPPAADSRIPDVPILIHETRPDAAERAVVSDVTDPRAMTDMYEPMYAAQSAAQAEPIGVDFLMADGGAVTVDYAEVVISGETLVLVSFSDAARGGFYSPPQSVGDDLRPITLTVHHPDLPPRLTAHRIHDVYSVGGRRHTVLLLDRGY